MYDSIIIGSGPAGITASLYMARAVLKVLIISKNQSALDKAEKIENYYGFECDVRQSKDKKFYIYHDMLYDGKLFKSFNSNEIICDTLESVLKLNTNKIILLEIKDPFIDIDNLVETLIKYSDKNIYVMSFYNTVIDKLNIKNKTYKVGILNYVLNTTEKHFKYDFICILRPLLNDKIIEFVKKNNKELFVYGNYNNNFKYDFPYYIVD